VRPPFPRSPEEHGVTHSGTPPSEPSGRWGVGAPTSGPRYDLSRPKAAGGSTSGGGDYPRYRSRSKDETSQSQTLGGRVPLLAVWQGGSLGRGAPRLGRTPT